MIIDGYVRGSTEEQEVTLDAQEAKIRGYHAVYGRRDGYEFELGEVVTDAGVSAKTLDRPGLRRALDRLARGESQGLIVAKLDRLTRDLGDWQTLIRTYFGEKPGKRLIAVDNEVNTMTSNGRMMLNMLIMVAQWERETIAERTRDALRHKIQCGERVGKVRYGHGLDEAGPRNKRGRPVRLTSDPREQEAVALMAALRAEGRSLRAIAAELKARGYRTREGRDAWAPGTIQKILKRTA